MRSIEEVTDEKTEHFQLRSAIVVRESEAIGEPVQDLLRLSLARIVVEFFSAGVVTIVEAERAMYAAVS